MRLRKRELLAGIYQQLNRATIGTVPYLFWDSRRDISVGCIGHTGTVLHWTYLPVLWGTWFSIIGGPFFDKTQWLNCAVPTTSSTLRSPTFRCSLPASRVTWQFDAEIPPCIQHFLGKPSIFHCFPHLFVSFSPGVNGPFTSAAAFRFNVENLAFQQEQAEITAMTVKAMADGHKTLQAGEHCQVQGSRVKCWSLLLHLAIVSIVIVRKHLPIVPIVIVLTLTYIYNLMYIRYLYIYIVTAIL